MSRRPGIGRLWYDKFYKDMYPWGKKVVRGHEVKTPRYYDGIYAKECPREFSRLKEKRYSMIDALENSMRRLLVKEEVTLDKINKMSRELEHDY